MKTVQILRLCLLSLCVLFNGIAMTACDDEGCDPRDPHCRYYDDYYYPDKDVEPCYKDKDCKPGHFCYRGYCVKDHP